MDISPDQVRTAVVSLIAFILSVTVHEFGHAWMANRLGDRLPAEQGRLTLSPRAHIDWLGTIVMPLVAAFAPGGYPMLAWGRPVQTNPDAYRSRAAHVLVSLMGPLMNFLFAVTVSIVLVLLAHVVKIPPNLTSAVIRYFVILNIVLMFFNLLPLPPLDGGAILVSLLPANAQPVSRALQRYGVLVFFALWLTGAMRPLMGPAYHVADAWTDTVQRLMYG